jgi:hypothetical protein
MSGWKDNSEERQSLLLLYLAGHDPWKMADTEIWPIIIAGALFVAQAPFGTAAILWIARCYSGHFPFFDLKL